MWDKALSQTARLRSWDQPALQKTSASKPRILPFLFTPIFHQARKGCRCPDTIISSSRLSWQRTGRPDFFAARATIQLNGMDRVSLPPKPPPRRLTLTTTLLAGISQTFAKKFWLLLISFHNRVKRRCEKTYVSVAFCVLAWISISPSSSFGIARHAWVSR